MSAPKSSSSQETPRAGAGHAGLRHSPELILVADDDLHLRESLGEVLRQENYAVRLACDGRDTVRQFLDGPPDLILLDVNMPDIDGWRAFQIIAQLYPFVPVIVITARPGQTRRAAELGIDKNGVRNEAAFGAGFAVFDQICADDAEIIVRNVRERRTTFDIAQRKNPPYAGLQPIVHLYEALLVGGNSRHRSLQPIGIRPSPRRGQQMRTGNR